MNNRELSRSGRPARLAVGHLPWAIVAVALAIAILPLIPPRPATEPAGEEFSASNALAHITWIAVEPRPMGSEGNRWGREKIVDELRALGLEPVFQTIEVPNYYSRAGESVEITNVLARIPGTDSTRAIALMGHHDTVPWTHGANDNTSAVAIMLESARAILAGPPLRNDVILLFTDAEEPAPRYGSTAFVDSHTWFDEIGFAINLEAIGRGGISVPVEIGGSSRWIAGVIAQATPYPTAFSFITAITELLGGSNTDFSPFRDGGVPGLDVAFLAGSSIYHTPADSIENVSARSIHQQGTNTLALTRHLGSLDLSADVGAGASTFFTIGRFIVVRYPSWLALPLALLAGIVWILALWRRRSLLIVLKGAGVTLVGALLSMVLAALIWTFIGRWRSTMGIGEGYVYLVLFGLVTLALSWGLAKLTRRQVGTAENALGLVAVLSALAVLSAVFVTGASNLFTWPALIGSVLLLWNRKASGRGGWSLARLGLVALVTLILLVPAIDFLFQFANPRPGNPDSEVLAAIVLPVLLLSLTTELLRAFWPRRAKQQAPA